MAISRCKVIRTGKVGADSLSVWRLLVDWGGWMDWYPQGQRAAPGKLIPPVIRHEVLYPATHVGTPRRSSTATLPLVRRVYLPDGGTIFESLLLSDEKARRIIYSVTGMTDIQNYIATVSASDAAGDGEVHWAAQFDLSGNADQTIVESWIGGIFNDAFIDGLRLFFDA
jgi:Polyketide cyclase / dehydrase and lipid transport